MGEFTMPSLGADMDEGTLREWLVHPGDHVGKGDIVAVVETDKSTVEVECFATGTIAALLVEPGTRVPVGTPLATIAEPGTPAPEEPGSAAARPRTAPRRAEPPSPPHETAGREPRPEPDERAGTPAPGRGPRPEPARPEGPPRRRPPAHRTGPPRGRPVQPPVPGRRRAAAPRGAEPEGTGPPAPPPEPEPTANAQRPVPEPRVASPLVRHLAHRHGVDLTAIRGTGTDGEITRADVERAVTPPPVKASPLARRLAAELGVDLSTVTGTGRDGAVRADDVRAAAQAAWHTGAARPDTSTPALPADTGAAAPGAARPTTPRPAAAGPAGAGARQDRAAAMRQAIARTMARSKREIPHYYLATTIDMTAALTWMRTHNRSVPVGERLVPAALLLKATAVALREFPQLNGFWIDDAFVPGPGVHVGVAISLKGGGLIAPALRDADRLPLPELMARLRDLVARARTGRLRSGELTDPTITVTDLGEQGVETVHGVIHPPQVALVGFGAVVERPWAVNGLLGVLPVVSATLAGDHRATDGYTGGRYLRALDRLLQHPEEPA